MRTCQLAKRHRRLSPCQIFGRSCGTIRSGHVYEINGINNQLNRVEGYALVITCPETLKLVENTIILVQVTKLPAEVVVYGNRLDRS